MDEQETCTRCHAILIMTQDSNDGMYVLPDGSAFCTGSFPLPKDHWLYADSDGFEAPPMPMRMGETDPRRRWFEDAVASAARYAVRASTMNGKDNDFDPDAIVQNMIVGLLGYHTEDGLVEDDWGNPSPLPEPFPQQV